MKILHQVWIQGEGNLPKSFQNNREMWRSTLPPGWRMQLWDHSSASKQWPEYAEVAERCSHHAMRADLILARALRDIGGLIMGTDCQPVNPQGLFTFIDSNPTMIVLEAPCPQVSSGLAWSRDPHHPYFTRLCQFQLRDLTRLADTFVAGVTGPTAWWETLRLDHWNLSLVTSRQAFVRQWDEKCIKNPLAWVDPGYAASWVK